MCGWLVFGREGRAQGKERRRVGSVIGLLVRELRGGIGKGGGNQGRRG